MVQNLMSGGILLGFQAPSVFIGYHLVRGLKAQGVLVSGVDIGRPSFGIWRVSEFQMFDLRNLENRRADVTDVERVDQLTSDVRVSGHMTTVSTILAWSNFPDEAHMFVPACWAPVQRSPEGTRVVPSPWSRLSLPSSAFLSRLPSRRPP